MRKLLWLLFIGPLWLGAEYLVLLLTALACLAGVVAGKGPLDGIRFQRAWLFWYLDLVLYP